jgi:antitoxin (DNA-binding transcriptional repressor) of toxin-antitoxin stability system
MQRSPQVEPVSNLQRNAPAVLRRLKNGPIFLSQRGKVAAAMVAIAEWDATAKLIEDLQAQLGIKRRLQLSNQHYAEAQADPSQWVSPEEYQAELTKAGLTG